MINSIDKDVLAPLNVLVVDDDYSVLKLISTMLAHLGVGELITTIDPKHAFALFKEHSNKINLVLCDWNMPAVTGLEMLQVFRRIKPELCFVMVTGSAEQSLVLEAKARGVSGFIKKPFSFSEIEKKLTALARIEKFRSRKAPEATVW